MKKKAKTATGNKRKKYEEKANKARSKVDRLGGSAADSVSKQSLGKTVLQASIFGSFGAMKYNQFRAEGNSRLVAGGKAVVQNFINNITAGLYGVIEPRVAASKRNKKG